ncbi:MAG: hypothetical protein NUV84_02320 [Candidatus Uhrbacteria bacterium]|nr:hypothetical protein [Candidatus Uhrbacteria bacterium]
MRSRIITFALVGFFISAPIAQSAMSSANFEIRWDTLSTGGSDTAASGSYRLRDTAESVVAGSGSSSSYQLAQGYRAGVDDQILTFEVLAQTTASARSATALSGLTVTASTTGISVNSLIAVVQDVGASQVAAIGRVASLGAGSITVDAWKNGGTVPTVDGTNDYVYPLTSTSVAFGELSTSSVTAVIIAFEVNSANDNGFVVQVFDDGNLRSGGNEINDVGDGSVTTTTEEYGARSSDTSITNSTFDTADTGITTTSTDVATESSAIFESRNFVTLKAAIDEGTPDGSYSHIIALIVSGNY